MKSTLKLEKHIIYRDELLQQTAREFGWTKDTHQFLEMVRSVFIAIRNRLSFESSLLFLNLLPLPFKALYINNWTISERAPDPLQNMDDLIDEVINCNPKLITECKPKLITKLNGDREFVKHLVEAVFRVIGYHVSKADLETEMSFLPEDVRLYLEKHHVGE